MVVDHPSALFSAQPATVSTQVGDEEINVVAVLDFLSSALTVHVGICFGVKQKDGLHDSRPG
jgi:hypothetical protein